MIEKKTEYQKYPKPDASNFLQDDVKHLEDALDLIDKDMYDLNQTKISKSGESEDTVDVNGAFTAEIIYARSIRAQKYEGGIEKTIKELVDRITKLEQKVGS